VDTSVRHEVPSTQDELVKLMDPYPNFTWADEHIAERVGGVPVNPTPSHEHWPWNRHNGNHQDGPTKVFSHTYPERMWCRYAGTAKGPALMSNRGIRFDYGDLQDVVDLLIRSPLTRQAYLPIWFPEDTGAAHRQRVPCTLGYHFMIRDGQLSCRYYMRSCDLVRHFADDVYLAARLMQWVTDQVRPSMTCPNSWHNTAPARHKQDCPECPNNLRPGILQMHIASLHAFAGDKYTLERLRDENVTPKQN
jgi:hypothetical protein